MAGHDQPPVAVAAAAVCWPSKSLVAFAPATIIVCALYILCLRLPSVCCDKHTHTAEAEAE